MIPSDVRVLIGDLLEPSTGKPLKETSRVSDVIISGQRVNITMSVQKDEAEIFEPLRQEIASIIEKHLRERNENSARVLVIMTAHQAPAPQPQDPSARGRKTLGAIENVIAIASGKGGVGKSTTTVNMAYAFKAQGYRVGILDADLYGPSIPKMLGIQKKPDTDPDDPKVMLPVRHQDIEVMSMGFLIEEEAPVIWRGPIIQKAIMQFLENVRWGNLDILLLDLPPGTGDIHLTLLSKISLRGAIVVSTPQDVALIDARRAIEMFRKLEVPILGLIENMSYLNCVHCGSKNEIFPHGALREVAQNLKIPFLSEVPLNPKFRMLTDTGKHQELIQDVDLGYPFRSVATTLGPLLKTKPLKASKAI